MVLDYGYVVQFGPPADLFAYKKGLFSALAWRIKDADGVPPRSRSSSDDSTAQNTYIVEDASDSQPRSCASCDASAARNVRNSNEGEDVKHGTVCEGDIVLDDTTEAIVDEQARVDV
eukprot:GEMP01110401.1.p1 GENE.GEMP01110401.1~~GEMP01110401.1.p1  ORF type:complete len:131 (+),score=27.42 GEMP01110401.1:43-393(+)